MVDAYMLMVVGCRTNWVGEHGGGRVLASISVEVNGVGKVMLWSQ